MKNSIRNWVTLIVLVWICFSVNVLEGLRSVPNLGEGKRWAVLVAGSRGYENYRHQADVCHAYQVLKKGGLKDENIIVFMYDDIANHTRNPRRGIIINKPNGPDVYKGVPKDYTGDAANKNNFFAVISGNRGALSGGSGKVVDSGPNDTIFIYYSDHGSGGRVYMPVGDPVMACDFVHVLMKKHATKSYKKMVIYLESCESGSMFNGILPNNTNIYATTASDSTEQSCAFYCPDTIPRSPPGYNICLGDAYSVAWLEDSEENDMTRKTLQQQYETVKKRTFLQGRSHVRQYGDGNLKNDVVATYIGASPVHKEKTYSSEMTTAQTGRIRQRDVHLLYLRLQLQKAPDGSEEKLKAQKELDDEIAHRKHVDNVFHLIGDLLFGEDNSSTMMFHVRPPGLPLVDDWDCFKTLIKTYEKHCDNLSIYGRKYTRAFANMCNAGISKKQLKEASLRACAKEIQVSE